MAKYQEFTTVLLKDGRIGTVTDVFEPDTYFVDIGTSPRDWDNIVITEDKIDRIATTAEIDVNFEKSKRQLKKMGLWGDKP